MIVILKMIIEFITMTTNNDDLSSIPKMNKVFVRFLHLGANVDQLTS